LQLWIETDLTSGYNQLDPIAIGILIATGAVEIWSTKDTSYLNWIATFVNMLILIFVIIAGLAHAKEENYKPFLCYGIRGIFSAASGLFFPYLGFDAVLTMAEETENRTRHSHSVAWLNDNMHSLVCSHGIHLVLNGANTQD
jgi:APA family basic amino acid/polyamine antiporter